jgi:magnesium chelatase subunit I
MVKYFPDPEKAKKSKTPNPYTDIINWFGDGNTVSVVDDLPFNEYKKELNSVAGLKDLVKKIHPRLTESQQLLLMEFVLHGLAEFSQLNKGFLLNGFAFSDMFNSLFNLEPDEDDLDIDDDRY